MARNGISKKMVVQAINRLTASHTAITVDAVRAEMGHTGSKTTICRYMKEQAQDASIETDKLTLLNDSLTMMIADIAAKLHDDVQAPLLESKMQYNAEREQWQIKYDDLLSAMELQQAANQRLIIEKDELSDTIKSLEKNEAQSQLLNAKQTQSIKSLEQQVIMQANHIASLEDKHIQSRDSLNHFRDAAKSQREQESQRHSNQVQLLQSELRQAAQELIVKQDKLSEQVKIIATLESNICHMKTTVQKSQVEIDKFAEDKLKMAEQLSALRVSLNTLKTAKDEVNVKLQYSSAEIKTLVNQVGELTNRNIQLTTEIEIKNAIMSKWMNVSNVTTN
ncbi:DNA-binding protein [Paraglaciecola sp.]|uniref:DNA-binding protein n=1 Tax=Paraglaciecola sp. TaxID=1920173 RepID=UPI0030F3CB1E